MIEALEPVVSVLCLFVVDAGRRSRQRAKTCQVLCAKRYQLFEGADDAGTFRALWPARARAFAALVFPDFSDELDPDWARREGSEAFGGPVEMAREGAVYEV